MASSPWTDDLLRARYLRLTTYRRTGEAVSTPVWFVVDEDALLVTTTVTTGKVKRIRHTSRVTICPSDRRGRPLGTGVQAQAVLLAGDAGDGVRRRVMQRYGLQGRILLGLRSTLARLRRGPAPVPIGIRLVRASPDET